MDVLTTVLDDGLFTLIPFLVWALGYFIWTIILDFFDH